MSEPKTSLYLQHPDFPVLIFNVITEKTPDGEMMRAVKNTQQPYKVRDFKNENIGLYLVLPDALAPDQVLEDDDGPFAMFVIPNQGASRPKRLDLTISNSTRPRHIRAVLIADNHDIRYDGDVPVHIDDSGLDEPFFLKTK